MQFIIFDEEIKDKLEHDKQSAFNDISNIFRFASEVLKTGGKVTVRRLANVDITITDESGLSAYKEGLNKLQRELNRKLIKYVFASRPFGSRASRSIPAPFRTWSIYARSYYEEINRSKNPSFPNPGTDGRHLRQGRQTKPDGSQPGAVSAVPSPRVWP